MKGKFSLYFVVFASVLFFGFSSIAKSDGGETAVTNLPNSIVTLVDEEKFDEAVVVLNKFVAGEKNNADAWNLLGYSQRKTGLLKKSLVSYRKALAIDPKHLGAHEYIGELFLMMDKPEKAEKHLKKLQKYCGDCEEALELEEAIAEYAG